MRYPAIDPVAFSIGPLPVRWYALAYMAGLLLGMAYSLHIVRLDNNEGPVKKNDIDDFFPWAVAGVILGGRIGYILFYQSHMYISDPAAMFRVWEGGMSFHGGALGVILAMILFAWRRSIPLLRLTDIICAAVPIGLFFGRLANFVNGELFGRVTDSSWGMVFPHGGGLPRHPSQLYESGLEGLALFLILAVLVHIKSVRERAGLVSGVFLAGYAAARAFLELFREPDAQIGFLFGGATMGQILCIPMALGGLFLIVRSFMDGQRDSSRENNPR